MLEVVANQFGLIGFAGMLREAELEAADEAAARRVRREYVCGGGAV